MIPKFRAWDKHVKKIRKVTEIHFDDSLIYLKANNGKGYYCSFSDIELMQSTGLKDKNGVEVFQGDIVRCTRGCPHEVVWLQEYAGMYIGGMPAWYLSGLSEGYAWTGNEEIIGNVYENPELLEQANES